MNPIKNLKNNWENPSFKAGFVMIGILYILMELDIVPSSLNSIWITFFIWFLITVIYEAFKPKYDIEKGILEGI